MGERREPVLFYVDVQVEAVADVVVEVAAVIGVVESVGVLPKAGVAMVVPHVVGMVPKAGMAVVVPHVVGSPYVLDEHTMNMLQVSKFHGHT